MKNKSLMRRKRKKARAMKGSDKSGGQRSLVQGAGLQLLLVRDFSQRARYPLDLWAAKPVKSCTRSNWPDRPDLGFMPSKPDMSEKTCNLVGASDGGVAQLVRAAES